MRDFVWKLTGWDFSLARRHEHSWRRPAMWTESGERIVDAGRCRLTITPPWWRRARAVRADQARRLAWRIRGVALDPIAQVSSRGRAQVAKRALSAD